MKKKTLLVGLLIMIVFLAIFFSIPIKDRNKSGCHINPHICKKSFRKSKGKTRLRISHFYLTSSAYPQHVINEDREVKIGDVLVLAWEEYPKYSIEVTIKEIKENSVVASFYTEGMVPEGDDPAIKKYDSVLEPWTEFYWTDEIPKDRCYEVYSYSLDSYLMVYLTFDIDDCDNTVLCGIGKVIYLWETGDNYEFGLFKNLIIADNSEYEGMLNNPLTKEEVMEYMNSEECGKCLNVVMVDKDKDEYRLPTAVETIEIS